MLDENLGSFRTSSASNDCSVPIKEQLSTQFSYPCNKTRCTDLSMTLHHNSGWRDHEKQDELSVEMEWLLLGVRKAHFSRQRRSSVDLVKEWGLINDVLHFDASPACVKRLQGKVHWCRYLDILISVLPVGGPWHMNTRVSHWTSIWPSLPYKQIRSH